MDTTDYLQEWRIKNKDAPYFRTGQVELPHGICSLFNQVDYLFPRITCISRIWLHTEFTEITE